MLAVEEVPRVAAVVVARDEAFEAGEHRRRPLPAIAEHLFDVIRAGAGWMAGDRRGIPVGEVERPAPCGRLRVSPREGAVAIAVRGTMPLRLARQMRVRPLGV